MESHYNIVSLIISTIIPMAMGFLYYHPKVLGNTWMNANGFNSNNMTPPKPALYVLALFCSFLFTLFLWAWVTGAGGADSFQVLDPKDRHSFVTFKHGVFHGILFTIMVLFPIFTTMSIFEQRKFSWALVNIGYWSLATMLMCGVLSAWR